MPVSAPSSLPASTARARSFALRDLKRIAVIAGLALAEILLATLLFKFDNRDAAWLSVVYAANLVVRTAFVAACAFVVIAWRERALLARHWLAATGTTPLAPAIAVNLAAFAGVMLAKLHLSGVDAGSIAPAWYVAYPAIICAAAASLALLVAPPRFWLWLMASRGTEMLGAVAVSLLTVALATLAREGWPALAGATLRLAEAILRLYEPDVVVDVGRAVLGVGDFRVEVLSSCSGIEGIALVLTFLAVFLVVFRHRLRFPNALILLPVAIVVSWLLNAVRIAALISIGAHLSPAMALGGFHSWAGWLAFIAVAAALMYGATCSGWLWLAPRAGRPSGAAGSDDDHALELLSPLVALLLAGMLAAAFAPHDQWSDALKIGAVALALAACAGYYVRNAAPRVSLPALFTGVLVGVLWLLTEPRDTLSPALADWFSQLSLGGAVLWLTLRGLTSVLLVPIAEELAFRGYLYRRLADASGRLGNIGALAMALLLSSLAFGLLHDRWLAASLAGLVYGLLLLRRGRIEDAVTAHMASNAVLFISMTLTLTGIAAGAH